MEKARDNDENGEMGQLEEIWTWGNGENRECGKLDNMGNKQMEK